ncbi:MAG: methyltransferase domain-containing protein [Patescibacteria group bacterium]|nr:methyltransferase domain-containing protein [Patescibacteria group bacterium]
MKILHLGCGKNKREGSVGVDRLPLPGVDVVFDLNQFPYPFNDNEFDLVVAEHILEHLTDLVSVVEEIYRVTKIGGRVEIICPHFSSADTFTDLTHQCFITSRSLDYFVPGSDLYKYAYSNKAKFKALKKELGPRPWPVPLKPLGWLINRFPVFYERRFAFLFPVGVIYFELEKI